MYERHTLTFEGEAEEIKCVQRCNLCGQLGFDTKMRVCQPLQWTPYKKGGSI